MRVRRSKVMFLIIISILFIKPVLCLAQYDYIDINNPFLKKIPIAVPLFKTFSDKEVEKKISKSASRLISETLTFTGYFKPLDRGAFLEDPQKSGIVANRIRFKNWTDIGAELLVTGGLLIKEDIIEMELRLFDTFKGRLLVGKRYKGWMTDQRKMIRRFCSEIIYSLTGNRGIFNSKIAFISTGSGNKEIYISDFDGYSPKQFTHNKSITLSPAWSSDGKWLSYTSYARGNPDIYIKNLQEKRGTVISKKGLNITPAWVPGKFELAATLSFSNDQEIYLLTGTGKIIKRLTNMTGIDVSPTWSPDGKKMAFVSKRSGTPQLYIKDIGSGQVNRLTFNGPYNSTPSWSPAGDRIAYTGIENGQSNIFVIGVDGSGPLQLTRDKGDNESPSWSPDGSLIAFASTREGSSRIYVMTGLGTDQKRLLNLTGEQTNPKWSPGVIDP